MRWPTLSKRLLASAPDGWVEGEVRQLSLASSGHCYLTLADDDASLEAVIWRSNVARCRPLPSAGDLVHAHWQAIDFYPPTGRVKLILDELEATGEGELLRRRQLTLARLQADGLCDEDRRKPLPAFPRRVGLIAGADSDAKVDVVRALRERFPPQDILFAPSLVQGAGAVSGIIAALATLQDAPGVDVIIIARGGGSVADLAAFDDEKLCRAVFACAVPVITSVGHTKDRPNCDHVAAAYAPVPARAAEFAIVYSAAELLESMERDAGVLAQGAGGAVETLDSGLAQLRAQLRALPSLRAYREELVRAGEVLHTYPRLIWRQRGGDFAAARSEFVALLADARRQLPRLQTLEAYEAQLQALRGRFDQRVHGYRQAFARLRDLGARDSGRRIVLARERLAQTQALLEAKDFRARGYALVSDEKGEAIKSVAGLRTGDTVKLSFLDGEADSTVTDIHPTKRATT